MQGIRIPACTLIIAIFAFGATSETFRHGTFNLLGNSIDMDAQLALLGFFNKLLDMMVQYSLEDGILVHYILDGFLTLCRYPLDRPGHERRACQAAGRHCKLFQKMHAIWMARHRLGWSLPLACLAISVCVLLLGVGVNTLGIPKERWYPNAGPWHTTKDMKEIMTIYTPQITLESID